MSRLEERYRRVLRLLPASYREVWEEDMVTAFLASVHTDDAEDADYLADYGRPGWAEVASVAALAVRLRLGLAGGSPRSAAWGSAVRLVGLLGLLIGAVVTTADIGFYLWVIGRLPALPEPPGGPVTAGFWLAILHIGGLVWVVAYVALLRGAWQVARALATVGLLQALTTTVAHAVQQDVFLSPWLHLLFSAVLVLALGAYEGHGSPRPLRPWLLSLAAGAAAVAGLSLVAWDIVALWTFLDAAGLYSLGVVGAAVGYLVARSLGWIDTTPAWPHALAMLAAAVLPLRLLTLFDYRLNYPPEDRLAIIATGLGQAAAVLAVGVPLAVLAARELRRLRADERRRTTAARTRTLKS